MIQYRDSEGNLRKELLDGEARTAAEMFVANRQGRVDRNQSVTSAQLRRFYGEFKNLEKRFDFAKNSRDEDTAFLGILPLVKMVKSRVAYATGTDRVPRAFADWLAGHVDAIETSKDFEAFLLHFEAVVGFCYGLLSSEQLGRH